jgi:hypothetical protein
MTTVTPDPKDLQIEYTVIADGDILKHKILTSIE